MKRPIPFSLLGKIMRTCFLWCTFLFASCIQLTAQSCDAMEGTVSVSADTICPGGMLTATAMGVNTDPAYGTRYLLADKDRLLLDVSNETGSFMLTDSGVYYLYAYNFEIGNEPSTAPAEGTTVLAVSDNGSACWMISAEKALVVKDTSAPVAVCSEQTIELSLDENGELLLNPEDFDFGSSDLICGGTENLSFSLDLTELDCSLTGQQTVELSVRDTSGNIATCSTTILVKDDRMPDMLCTEAFDVFLDGAGTATLTATDVDAGSTDNCGIQTLEISSTAFDCQTLGAQEVTLTATDEAGNSNDCAVMVTVRDTLAPDAVCANQTVYLDADGLASLTAEQVGIGSSDNCDIQTLSLSQSSFGCSDLGVQEIELTALSNGLEDKCTAMITVADTTAPTALCQDVTIYLESNGSATLTAADVDAGSADNCGSVNLALSQTAFNCENSSETVRLTVSDASTNSAECTATITIRDTIPPDMLCAEAFDVFLDGAGTATLTAADVDAGSTDNCGIQTLEISSTAFDCQTLGAQEVTLTATDEAGNSNDCAVMVTVRDTIAPDAVCANQTVYLDADGLASLTAEQVGIGSTDNCDIQSLSLSQSSFGCSDLGVQEIELTALSNGLEDKCTAMITVADTTAPTALCQDITIYLESNGSATLTAADVDAGSADNCGSVNLTLSQTAFNCENSSETVRLTVSDASTNSAECTATITIRDTIPPAVVCQDVEVMLNEQGSGNLSVNEVVVSSLDNCGISTRTLSQTSFSCEDLGEKLLELTVEDVNGNRNACTFTATVQDTTGPAMSCQNRALYLDASGTGTIDPAALDNGSADLCGGAIQFSASQTSFGCTELGAQQVILTGTDQFGNSSTCTALVSVIDTVSPVAECLEASVRYLDANGMLTVTPEEIDNNSTDNCTIDKLSLNQTTFDCSNLGENTLTLTVEDFAGNSTTCLSILTVADTTSPVAACRSSNVFLDENGLATVNPLDVEAGSTDNCGEISSVGLSRTAFDCSALGENSVVLTVFDASGNQDTCMTTVTVVDIIVPTAECQDVNVYLDENGGVSLDPAMLDNGSTDNCGSIAEFLASTTDFNCEDIGEQEVILTVKDASGGSNVCTSTVTVLDTLAPVAVCRPFTVFVDANGLAVLKADSLNDGSTDNCGSIQSFTASESRFTCSDVGTLPVQLTVTDPSGNEGTCTTMLTVADTILPVLTCQDVSVYLDATGVANLSPEEVDNGSRDNCGVLTDRSLSKTDFGCTDLGAHTVKLYATDNSLNRDSCSATVTVLDTIAPVVRCKAAELEVNIDGDALLSASLINDASTDNCTITRRWVDKTNFTCADLGENTVKLYIEDASGNQDSCTTILTVVDRNQPIIFTQDITVELGADGTVAIDSAALDNGSRDNCEIVEFTVDKSIFTCEDLGDNLVTLTGIDSDGNRQSRVAVVTVVDNSGPNFDCIENVSFRTSDDGGNDCGLIITDNSLDPVDAFDNCQVDTIFHDYTAAPNRGTLLGATFLPGTETITWTIRDVNGLEQSCSFELTVVDDEAPIANCRDTVLVRLSPEGMLTIDSATVDNGSTDNCSIVDYQLSRVEFGCADVGFHAVNIRMQDATGNESTCEVTVGVVASEACPEPAVAKEGGPDIGDPCTCRGDGAFDEEVFIGPTTPNQIWEVETTTLRDPLTMAYYPAGTRFQEVDMGDGTSIYILIGVHLDGEGYTMAATSPLFPELTLTISNRCFYPDPQIIGLDGPFCLFSNPVPLEGTGGEGVVGNGSFTINGQVATVFDPNELGTGTHIVQYAFDAGNPASAQEPDDVGCAAFVTKEVRIEETPAQLACNDKVTISMNMGCEIFIHPDLILEGNYLCYDDYEVFLGYNGQSVPNPVPATYAGFTLDAVVQHKPTGRICGGSIELRDVTGPQIDQCAPNITEALICSDFGTVFNNIATIDPLSPYYTGRPLVEDNCSGTTITFRDVRLTLDDCDVPYADGIRRIFTARDQFNNTSSCEQLIYFSRPTEIFFPEDTLVREDCNKPAIEVDENGNVATSVSGKPYVINGFGEKVELDDSNNCGFSALYEDQRLSSCAAQYSVVRTWEIFDWCASAITLDHTQLIEVGDFDAPVVQCPRVDLNGDGLAGDALLYSVSGADCMASFSIPQPRVTECSDYTVSTKIFSWVAERDRFGFLTGDTIYIELPDVVIQNNTAANVPVGDHFFVYTVEDICGNTAEQTCAFKVRDLVTPTVFCDNSITVSLGSDNSGRILPIDIDEGSRDNCDGQDIILEVRRLVPKDCSPTGEAFYTAFAPFAELGCCDVGRLVTVEMRVTDRSGNSNLCVSYLEVEDNMRPSCTPPINLTVDCNDLPANFDAADPQTLQNSFGVPTITDNCGASWTELAPVVDLGDCGAGTIRRRFSATDNSGNESQEVCEQRITLRSVHNYEIRFPQDISLSCGQETTDTLLTFNEIACDLLAVSVKEANFDVSTNGCYQIRRTYDVINWCEYDGESPAVTISRDADCDQVPGDEAVWLMVRPDGSVYLDRDNNERNSIPAANSRGRSCDGQSNQAGHWQNSSTHANLTSVGYWSYTQFITVVDSQRPVITFAAPEAFCSTTDDCQATVTYPFTVAENCTPDDLTISVAFDRDRDGFTDGTLAATRIKGVYPDFEVEASFPLGSHSLLVEVSDGCGNTTVRELPFEVVDCKGPAPICISGFAVELSALGTPADIDGDGIEDLASAQVLAADFISGPLSDCSGPVSFSINRKEVSPQRNQTSLTLSCADEGIVLVEVHAWDARNNHDFCETFVDVQNNGDVCNPIPEGSIAGTMMKESGETLAGVRVQLSGSSRGNMTTTANGAYAFDELPEGDDYSVTPSMDVNYNNGVSTFDLVLIRKHILNLKPLDSPYKLIAADANSSGNVSIVDLIILQKIILGIEIDLEDNSSWRFVAQDYNFPNPQDPWQEAFPEIYNINNLPGQVDDVNFIGIKIGDVNNTSSASGAQTTEVRSSGVPVVLHTDEQPLVPGTLLEVPIRASDLSSLEGYQFSLSWDRGQLDLQDVVPVYVTADHFGVFAADGLLTTNWLAEGNDIPDEAELFRIQFKVKGEGRLSEALHLSTRITQAEAYDKTGAFRPLALQFGTERAQQAGIFELYQNQPNPFVEETQIGFYLPEAGEGVLRIYDVRGTLLRQVRQEFTAGRQTINVMATDLPPGVLYYTFQSGTYFASKKMVRQ